MDIAVVRCPVLDEGFNLLAYRFMYLDVSAEGVGGGAEVERAVRGMWRRVGVVPEALKAVQKLSSPDFAPLWEGALGYVPLPADVIMAVAASRDPSGGDPAEKGLPGESLPDFLLHRTRGGIEVPTTGGPAPGLLEACIRLRDDGWPLLLLDSPDLDLWQDHWEDFSVVQVDFACRFPSEQRVLVSRLCQKGVCVLASRVRSRYEVAQASDWGCAMFDGRFLTEPDSVGGNNVEIIRTGALALLREITEESIDYRRIEHVVKQDPALSIGLLRHINVAAQGVRQEISSIRQALVFLGERKFRRWVALFVVSDLAESAPREVLSLGLTRAFFAELIAKKIEGDVSSDEAFLGGLLSVLDVLLCRTLAQALETVPVSKTVKMALYGCDNWLKQVLDLVFAWERGDFPAMREHASRFRLHAHSLQEDMVAAVEWANGMCAVGE